MTMRYSTTALYLFVCRSATVENKFYDSTTSSAAACHRIQKGAQREIRTHAAQKEGCAERIAPIGTLSQNGYGEDLVACTSAYLTTNCAARLRKRNTSRRNETHGARRIAELPLKTRAAIT